MQIKYIGAYVSFMLLCDNCLAMYPTSHRPGARNNLHNSRLVSKNSQQNAKNNRNRNKRQTNPQQSEANLRSWQSIGNNKPQNMQDQDELATDGEADNNSIILAICNGDIESIKAILKKDQLALDVMDSDGYDALYHVIKKGDLEILKLVLKNIGKDQIDIYDEHFKVADEDKNTLLIQLIRLGKSVFELKTVQSIIGKLMRYENGLYINLKNNEGKTALDYALETNVDSIIESIVKYKAILGQVNESVFQWRDENGRTLLMLAIECGNKELVKQLINDKSNTKALGAQFITAKDGQNKTALSYAIQAENKRGVENFKVVKWLVKNGATLGVTENNSEWQWRDEDGRTLLMLSIKYANNELVNYLITNQINNKSYINMGNNEDKTALDYAMKAHKFEISELLMKYKAMPGKIDKTILDVKDENGRTLLMLASQYNNIELVKRLIKQECDLNVKDNEGKTALDYAMKARKFEISKLLMKYKAMPGKIDKTILDVKDENGRTLLMLASQHNNIELVKQLWAIIEKEGDVNVKDNEGKTALDYALEKGNLDIIYLFKDGEAWLDTVCSWKDENGCTLLMLAIKNGNTELAEYLISNQLCITEKNNKGNKELGQRIPYIDIQNNKGKFALSYAIQYGRKNIIKKLMEVNVNINSAMLNRTDINGNNLLMLVTRVGNVGLLTQLIQRCKEIAQQDKKIVLNQIINVRNRKGESALSYAVKNNEMCKLLILNGATIDSQSKKEQAIFKDESGESLLFSALDTDVEWFSKMVESGANVNIKQNDESLFLKAIKKVDSNQVITEEESYVHPKDGINRKIFELLILHGLKIDSEAERAVFSKKDETGEPLLIRALKAKHTKLVGRMIDCGADVNMKDKDGKPLLFLVATLHYQNLVKKLMKNNVDIKATDDTEKSMLYNRNVLMALLKNGWWINQNDSTEVNALNQKDKEGNTLLMDVVKIGDLSLLRQLIQYRALNVNSVNNQGETALYLAAMSDLDNKENMMGVLMMEAKANISNVLDREKVGDSYEIKIDEFYRRLANTKYNWFISAANHNDTGCIMQLLDIMRTTEQNSEDNQNEYTLRDRLNAVDSNGNNALVYAIKYKMHNAIELLISQGAKTGKAFLDWKDEQNKSLTQLLKNNSLLKDLLNPESHNKDITNTNWEDKGKNNLLMRAIKAGDKKYINWFLDSNNVASIINERNDNLETPLMLAVKTGNKKIIKKLIEKGADINAIDKNGNTALSIFQSVYSKIMEKQDYQKIKKLLKSDTNDSSNITNSANKIDKKHHEKESIEQTK